MDVLHFEFKARANESKTLCNQTFIYIHIHRLSLPVFLHYYAEISVLF